LVAASAALCPSVVKVWFNHLVPAKEIAACLLAFLAANSLGAEANSFLCQTITLPAKALPARFADLDHNGRCDLLAVDAVAGQLLIYRQRASGFANAPDQTLALPPQTAWIAPYSVAGRTNRDLLISTATGLVYFRQTGGVFESAPRPLIHADQVFGNDDSPNLLPFLTNAALPVISATQAWLYLRNEASATPPVGDEVTSRGHEVTSRATADLRNEARSWTSGPPMALNVTRNSWSGSRNAWTLGLNSSYTLDLQQSLRSRPDEAAGEPAENDTLAKLLAEMKKAGPWNQPQLTRVDLNQDGRLDLILWQVVPDSFRTEVYVFLRGADGLLPERPTQVLHCRGVPFPVGSTQAASPIADLRGDGASELVLLEPDVMIVSASSLVDLALSRGMDVALTIRSFHHGAFSHNPEASVPLTVNLSWYGSRQWPLFIYGDFNGDGRPDLVVQRSSTQWAIIFSTNDGHWFQPLPAMTFEIPMPGYFERRYFDIADLNGDGRSDIVSHDLDDPRIFIFLTQPNHPKVNP